MDEYARFARLYDPIVGPFLRPVHRSMVRALKSRQARKVVDLCCGTGLLAGLMVRAGMSTVGVDLSPDMLSVARDKNPQATFIDCDASNLFFGDDEFDAATISFALHEKSEITAYTIVSEALRVLRPGGLLLVADYRKPIPRQSRWAGLGIECVERLAGREHHAHFKRYMDKGGTESFLIAAGLSGLPAMTFMHGWAGLYINMK